MVCRGPRLVVGVQAIVGFELGEGCCAVLWRWCVVWMARLWVGRRRGVTWVSFGELNVTRFFGNEYPVIDFVLSSDGMGVISYCNGVSDFVSSTYRSDMTTLVSDTELPPTGRSMCARKML